MPRKHCSPQEPPLAMWSSVGSAQAAGSSHQGTSAASCGAMQAGGCGQRGSRKSSCLLVVGMNATVLNGAHIGKNSIVGAGAVVSEGKEFPENSLILGVPARLVKEVTPKQIQHIQDNADNYVKLSKQYKED